MGGQKAKASKDDTAKTPPAPAPSPAPEPRRPSVLGGVLRGTAGAAIQNPAIAFDALAETLATLEIELKGEPRLEPNPLAEAYIDGSGSAGALLRVRYGQLARGRMVIRLDDGGFQADTTFLDFTHRDLAPRDGKRIVLAVEISNSEITGKLGASSTVSTIGVPGRRHELDDSDLFSILFGRSYTDLDSLDLVKFRNELAGGELNVSTGFILTPPDGPQISGGLAIVDGAFAFGANTKVDVIGLSPTTAPITRTRSGILMSQIPDLNIAHEWNGKGFSGAVKASYVDGTFLANGRLSFQYPSKKPRLKGLVNVIVTSPEDAWAWARSHDPAPTITGGLHPTGYAKRLALAGSGVLELEIAPGITASGSFLLDPDGYVTAKGSLRALGTYELLKKQLKGKDVAKWDQEWKLPVARAPVFLGVEANVKIIVELVPSVALLVSLRDMAVTGLYSTRPNTGTQLDIEGSLNVSATAGLHASAMLKGAVQLGWDVTIPVLDWNVSVDAVSVSVGVAGDAVLQAYADIHPKITRSTVADPSAEEADYRIRGHIEAGGRLDLELSAAGGLDFLGFWKPTFKTGSVKYGIGGGAIAVDFDHTLGKDAKPKIVFTRPDFNPQKFVDDIQSEKSVSVRDRYHGSARGGEPGSKSVATHEKNTPEPEQAKPGVELDVPFELEHRSHHLYLVFPEKGHAPHVDIASTRERLSSKLERAAENVRFTLPWTDEEHHALAKQQIVDLMNLALDARGLEADAMRLGSDTGQFFEAELPGLEELAEKLAKYAERYDDPELIGATRVVDGKIEKPVVSPEKMLEPGTQNDVLDAEVRQWLANHKFTLDPVTRLYTRNHNTERLELRNERWTFTRDDGRIQEEYDVRRYGSASTGGDGLFQSAPRDSRRMGDTSIATAPRLGSK